MLSKGLQLTSVSIIGLLYVGIQALKYYNTSPTTSIGSAATANATLGFGEIVVINMDHRHDRRDQMTVLASVGGLRLTFSSGVSFATRQETLSGMPPYQPADMPLTKLGCFRAHANVWRRFLEESKSDTALVLEDDVDWDVDIRTISANLQERISKFAKASFPGPSDAADAWAYKHWDILRLGTCREPAHKRADRSDAFTSYEDPSVPVQEWMATDTRMTLAEYDIPMTSINASSALNPRWRLLQVSNYPVCLQAYAITRLGAAKLLQITGEGLIDGANDLTIAQATKEGRLRSISVLPSIFAQWKVLGWDGNSDNGAQSYGSKCDEGPRMFAWDVRDSIRLLLPSILEQSSSI